MRAERAAMTADHQCARKRAQRTARYQEAEPALIGEENLFRDVGLQCVEERECRCVQHEGEQHDRAQMRRGPYVFGAFLQITPR